MKKGIILFAATLMVVAGLMTSCIGFKTEATVEVTVVKDGQPQKNVQVYRFNDNGLGEGTTLYKTNAHDIKTTNGKGVVRFELKSPEDLEPSDAGIVDKQNFFFATYDDNDRRNGFVAVEVATGDKKKVTLEIIDAAGGEEF